MTCRSLNRCEKCTCVQTSCTTQVTGLYIINVYNLVMLIYFKRLLPLSSDLNSNNRAPVGCSCSMTSPFLSRRD